MHPGTYLQPCIRYLFTFCAGFTAGFSCGGVLNSSDVPTEAASEPSPPLLSWLATGDATVSTAGDLSLFEQRIK